MADHSTHPGVLSASVTTADGTLPEAVPARLGDEAGTLGTALHAADVAA